MSSRTPNKERSSSKKTPSKSATNKQQTPKQQLTPSKSTPHKSNKTNLIQDIKQQFLTQSLSQLSQKELSQQLKRILAVEGVDTAVHQLIELITTHKVHQQIVYQALSKLSQENLSGLVYLLERIVVQPRQNQQTNKLHFIDLIDWVNALWKLSPDLVSYSENLKQSINSLSTESCFDKQLSSVKGKIALLTHN